jgi:hypothetical protein
MSSRNFSSILAMLALATALAACQSAPPTPTPIIIIIPAMPGQMNLVAGCQPRDLDNWTEEAGYLTGAFAELMNQAVSTPREGLLPVLEQMHTYKSSIDALIVPADCAQETHSLISITVAEVINTFEEYRTDSTVDTRPVVTRAQATLQLVEARIADLSRSMDATHQAQHR